MSTTDEFEQVWQDGQGAAVKETELVNRTFTIHSARKQEFTTRTGEEAWSWMTNITFDGEEETHEAWIGGRGSRAQVAYLVEKGLLPAHVKEVMVEKAYKLQLLGEKPQKAQTAAKTPAERLQGLIAQLADDVVLTELADILPDTAIAYGDDGNLMVNTEGLPLSTIVRAIKALE